MAVKVDAGEETQLNMTPMIDICFQLIVFFMLTLKFKSIDKRFETELPKDRGPSTSAAVLTPLTEITVKLFRKDVEKKQEEHFTRIRVGDKTTVDLPKGPWPKEGDKEDARRKEEDGKYKDVTSAIAAAWAEQNKHPDVKGEIKTPAPTGQLVPHGDVMRVLDSFIEAGVLVVNFEGAPPPVGMKEGGGWDFAGG
jgi:biopolymer transport protein ExbD